MKLDRSQIRANMRTRARRLMHLEHVILLTFGATIMGVVVAAIHLA